ncbi:hypothetical protein, partial [Hyphomicrobium sulfonivorans]|uniref:hypothetical protein n=1 Tax=Hyphomicrobium sulfonivorans TaxID=121290 RepID=UPI000B041AD1
MSWNLKPLRDAAVGSIAVVALSAGTAARADNTDQLEAQLRIMQDQIRHLQQQIEDNRAEARAQAEKQAAKKKDDLDL